MGGVQQFTGIIAWQRGHELVLKVYSITRQFPKEERYRLVDQLCRAAISFPANIAEGFKRKTRDDKLRFYNFSLASLEETKYYFLLAKDLRYISEEEFENIFKFAEECGRLLHGWIQIQH